MTLRNVENVNGDNIQEVMAEVEETAEEESIPGPVNLNENIEEDEGENDIEVEVKSNTTAIEQDEDEKQPEVVIKPVVDKKYQPSAQDKSISKLQDQLNKHFDRSKKTDDLLKQIERKMEQIDKIVIVSNKQHEIIRKMQVQFNDIQRTLTKIDRSNTSLRSRSAPKSKPSAKVDKKNRNKSRNSKKGVFRKKLEKLHRYEHLFCIPILSLSQ
jgi:hypothetical protein